MAVRLSNYIREQVLNAVLKHAFEARGKALEAEKFALGDAVYNDIYPEPLRKQMAALPDGFLPTLGDIPAPAKWTHSELGKVYEEAERRVLATLGLLPGLLPDEEDWLKAVDTLELWLWCREEEALGNEAVTAMRRACEAVTEKRGLEGSLPEPVRAFYVAAKQQPHRRLSDFFEEVVRDGLGEAAT